jgi:Meiotically Up-regulated Gene 113 (MUG113) protein
METKDVVLPLAYPREGVPAAPHAYYVYFIYCAGRVKIGRAVDVAKRMSSVSTGSPFRPVVLLAISGSLSAEREVHTRFAEDRVHREWFRLSDHLRRYLVRRLDTAGLAEFRKAEDEFLESLRPASDTPRKWSKPKKLCSHGKPLSKPCAKCTREAALRVYEDLVRRAEGARQ